jgi:hypothetical protein
MEHATKFVLQDTNHLNHHCYPKPALAVLLTITSRALEMTNACHVLLSRSLSFKMPQGHRIAFVKKGFCGTLKH